MYRYEELRPTLFTEAGAEKLEKIRRNVRAMLTHAGAVRSTEALTHVYGDIWEQRAVLDYLVEKGEIREVTGPDTPGQNRVYVAGPNAVTVTVSVPSESR